MNVLQAIGSYFPESSGGTEVYVEQLSLALRTLGINSQILAPQPGGEFSSSERHGLSVLRYPSRYTESLTTVRDHEEDQLLGGFRLWLASLRAEVYHQHNVVSGCGLEHLAAARESGKKTVVTLHTVGMICLRGDLRLFDRQNCDGKIHIRRCSDCWARQRGWPTPVARLAKRVPTRLSRQALRGVGPLATLAGTPALVEQHRDRLRRLESIADRIVVTSEWMRELLLENGLGAEKIRICELAVPKSEAPTAPSMHSGPLRIGFLGRLYPLKGIDLLVDAARRVSRDIPFQLFVHAIDGGDRVYAKRISELALGDPRIHIEPGVAHEAVGGLLSQWDVLAIPSQGMETGPLVALEAMAAGVPILATALGNLKQWVREGDTGWLIPPQQTRCWTEAIERLAQTPASVRALRRSPGDVRSLEVLAREMSAIYAELFP